ncbi:MAG TPA: HEAT repeat domain-containing protein [Bryobacteraceae bacterium]|jgi:HEAT repeat protein|nr:HEAT repeat domain-containing protein [Bryobacteraceae bacterium]
MRAFSVALVTFAFLLPLTAQDVKPKDVREVAKGGAPSIPTLQKYLKNQPPDVRAEAVKQLTDVGTAASLDPLILATQDDDPQIQILATDGMVNFYSPGYVKTGITAPIRKVGSSIKGKFTDTNDLIIPAYVTVRADVVAALARMVKSGVNADVRANAAHAAGILRAKDAEPELLEAVHTKDTDVIYEALVALQKIRDQSAGPAIAFRLRDMDQKVQIAAIQTTGVLLNKAAVPDLIDVLNRAKSMTVKREALTAIAMLPVPSSRSLYEQYLHDKDDRMRAAAAEGFARLKNPADLPMLTTAWQSETKTAPRLSLAFAQVMLGKTEMGEFSPLRFLINNLNSSSYNGVAYPFLVELARDETVRQALYAPMATGTKDEKIGLARVLARSGDSGSVAALDKLSKDPDPAVAQEGLKALRTLQSRL